MKEVVSVIFYQAKCIIGIFLHIIYAYTRQNSCLGAFKTQYIVAPKFFENFCKKVQKKC